jgi:protein-export membrane protein SecD
MLQPSRRTWIWISTLVLVSAVGSGVVLWGALRGRLAHYFSRDQIVLEIDAAHPFDEGVSAGEAIRRTAATITDRAEKLSSLASVDGEGARLRVHVPSIGEGLTVERLTRLLTRAARLEFKLVDDGASFMSEVTHSLDTRPIAGVEVGHDAWTEKDSGTPHADLYLSSTDLKTLRDGWRELFDRLGQPKDHTIALEKKLRPDGSGTRWRSYFLRKEVGLTGDFITDAEVSWDPQTGHPEVSLTFDEEGARRFAKLTGASIGRKLAIVLDGVVNSAPVIEGRITGGHARITLGGGDPFTLQEEAKDLVALLRVGSLAAPVRVVEIIPAKR